MFQPQRYCNTVGATCGPPPVPSISITLRHQNSQQSFASIARAVLFACTTISNAGIALAANAETNASYVQINPSERFSGANWLWSLECGGITAAAQDLPENGLIQKSAGISKEIRSFGRIADPDDPTKQVFEFTARKHDPLIWGAPRCEITVSPSKAGGLHLEEDFWFGIGFYLPNWEISQDEQVVAQWHMNEGGAAFSPFFAVAVQGNSFRIQAQANTESVESKRAFFKVVDVRSATLPVNKWSYIITHARISPKTHGDGFLDVWLDGRKIVEYKGPLGYPTQGNAFLKFGHYHWMHPANPWPEEIEARTVLIRSPTLVFNSYGTVTAKKVEDLVRGR